jgi:AcrR family transcriptional regulator
MGSVSAAKTKAKSDKRSGRKSRRRGGVKSSHEPETSRAEILAVATEEFAQRGLAGARVDAIAERTRTSKRMIYYYFGSKEGLYTAVLEHVYSQIRTVESELDLDALTPIEAMRRLVELTFDYDESHPHFISLVNVENVNHGQFVAQLTSVRKRYSNILQLMQVVLDRGVASGEFRADVDATDARLVIGALCFFRVSNRYTFGALFDCDLAEPHTRRRHRQMIVDAVLRFLRAR